MLSNFFCLIIGFILGAFVAKQSIGYILNKEMDKLGYPKVSNESRAT